MVASGRIDISSQTGCCDGSPVTVSRSKPAILEGHMNQFAWNSFCDKIDEALEPATRGKKVMGVGGGSAAAIGITITVIGFVLFGMGAHASVSSFGESGSPMIGFALFGAGGGIMMLGCVGSACYAGSLGTRAKEGMRKVCAETTAMHPRVSFHVRDEIRFWTSGYGGYGDGYWGDGRHAGGYHPHRDVHTQTTNYIEVYVADTAGAPGAPAPVTEGVYAAPSAPPLAVQAQPAVAAATAMATAIKTPAERLRELEAMRDMISKEEYLAKRAEIMSDV